MFVDCLEIKNERVILESLKTAMNLSIIVPCYNEENQVVKMLHDLLITLEEANVESYEVIIVDDASTDNSFKALENFISNHSSANLKLLAHEKNKGKGVAITTGVEGSTGEYILIQDADLELDVKDIPSLIDASKLRNIEFVNGSRYMPGIIRPLYAYKRYYLNKTFTRLASILVDVRFTDIACGYKLFSRKLFDKLELKEKRFGIETEMIIKAARLKKNQIVEVPVNYYPRNIGEGKKIRNIDGLRILWVIFKYGLLKRF
jgi:glycosyltransferase involved in cell wall biosynthesis